MNIGDILSGIKDLGTKAAGTLGSMLSSPAPTQTMGSLLAPTSAPKVDTLPTGHIPIVPPEISSTAQKNAASLVSTGKQNFSDFLANTAKVNADREKALAMGAMTPEGRQALMDLTSGFVGSASGAEGKKIVDSVGKELAPVLKTGAAKVQTLIGDLVKAVTPQDTHALLTGAGMADAKAAQMAPALARASTPEDVSAILYGKAKGAPKVAPVEPVQQQMTANDKKAMSEVIQPGEAYANPQEKAIAGITMYGKPSEGLGMDLATRNPIATQELGVLANGENITVRRDARAAIRILSDRVQDDFKIQKLSDLRGKLESAGTKEGDTIAKAIDNMLPTKTPTGVKGAPSVGDILAGGGKGGGKSVPPLSRETAPGPIPSGNIPERKFITRTKAMAPEAAPLLEGQYARRDTNALVAEADARIAKDPAAALTFAKTDTTEAGVATASRLLDNFIGQAKLATDEATKNALYAKAAEVANDAAKNLTEHGRAIQAATILGKLTPEGMVRWAAGEIQKYNEVAGARTMRNFLGGAKKIPELTPEQTASITDQMQKIADMTNMDERAQAFAALQKEVKAYIPSSLYQKIIALWKAGLLTGIKTTGLNIASNAAHAASEIIKDVPAALVDRITSLFTGKRTLALTTKGVSEGVSEGIKKGWRFLKTGYDERDALGAIDFHAVNFGKGKIAQTLQKYEESVFGLLGAEDQPFYYGAKTRSLYSQAIATAKNEGLKGPAIASRVNELVANPTDEMLKYAVMDAQTAVFQNKTELGKVASALQRAPGGQIILPFGKTPAAVATQMINYSPAGIVKTIIENAGKGRFDQRLFSQGIGRGLTGTGVLAIGAALYNSGLMTTTRPTSEGEQKQWQLEGKAANMINIDGTWRNINVLGPLGMVLAIGANMQQGISETGSFVGGLGAAVAGAGSSLTQQTFLYGINQAINALNNPAQYGKTFINNLVGSVIPTLVADIARSTDPLERQTNTISDRLASRVPGLRELLQPQVDTLGTKVQTPGFFTTLLDPTRPATATADKNDPVVLELRRLADAGFKTTPTQLGGTSGYKSLTPEQNTQLWEVGGKFAKMQIQKVMTSGMYRRLDDEQKSKAIAKAVDDSKVEARARVIYTATKGLTGLELNKALSTYKADKLLTKQVYTRYTEMKRFGK